MKFKNAEETLYREKGYVSIPEYAQAKGVSPSKVNNALHAGRLISYNDQPPYVCCGGSHDKKRRLLHVDAVIKNS